MEPIKLKLNNEHSVGLGDNLCMLSALANLPPPVELSTNNNHNTFERLSLYKRAFEIPDDKLKILPCDDNGDFQNVGWPTKLFSDYWQTRSVTVKGKTHAIDYKQDRKCIAIATSFDLRTDDLTKWPYCRSRPINYWARIFEIVKKAGFEVITVDNPFHDLEDKIELMARHCAAIISYEGGMAHLAHMLGLPCFLVDWKLPSPSTNLDEFHCEFVHQSRTVYHLREDREILRWNEDNFRTKINELHEGRTNNRLVNGECKLQFAGPGITGKISILDRNGRTLKQVDGMYGMEAVHSRLLNQFYSQ